MRSTILFTSTAVAFTKGQKIKYHIQMIMRTFINPVQSIAGLAITFRIYSRLEKIVRLVEVKIVQEYCESMSDRVFITIEYRNSAAV